MHGRHTAFCAGGFWFAFGLKFQFYSHVVNFFSASSGKWNCPNAHNEDV
jgi:hypothetical protein